jgi:hypothetical protein
LKPAKVRTSRSSARTTDAVKSGVVGALMPDAPLR